MIKLKIDKEKMYKVVKSLSGGPLDMWRDNYFAGPANINAVSFKKVNNVGVMKFRGDEFGDGKLYNHETTAYFFFYKRPVLVIDELECTSVIYPDIDKLCELGVIRKHTTADRLSKSIENFWLRIYSNEYEQKLFDICKGVR